MSEQNRGHEGWTFRNGKVIHFRSYRDPDEALEAVGYSFDAHRKP